MYISFYDVNKQKIVLLYIYFFYIMVFTISEILVK